jgi:hypothetical protein
MEIIKLFRIHDTTYEGPSFKVLSGPKTHCNDICLASSWRQHKQLVVDCSESTKIDIRHFINDLLRDLLPTFFALRSLGLHDSGEELSNDGLKIAMIVGVVWAVVSLGKPCWLAVRHPAQFSGNRGFDLLGLTLHSPNLELLVLWAEQNFVPMQAEEELGSIFSS